MLDKKVFYEQLDKFANIHIPIHVTMPINNNSKYSICLHEFRKTTDKLNHEYYLQIYDRTKSGYPKYMCKDIFFNLVKEHIFSKYQLYKFINSKLLEVLEND